MTLTAGAPVRHRLRVTGVVQGVGFRPHVHRLAAELGLTGFVGNDSEGVFVEAEGPRGAVEEFEARLVAEAPPLAAVEGLEAHPVELVADQGFRIVASRSAPGAATFLPPDVAVCDDCLAELFDPGDRRYRYPFITCTNCGPRFTITRRLPYDRPHTTMAGFTLCAACAAQYHDPADRRFHAQPLACAACGPRLWFEGPDGPPVVGTDAALAAAQTTLAAGGIVAVKGIGGYHLACDATDAGAVARLRDRKRRPAKPLAVMVPDLAAARALADLDDTAAALLASPARPIVLVPGGGRHRLAGGVAPGSPLLGLLLPYAPLHHLLFAPVPGRRAPVPGPLVMTSGNLADEPICFDDAEARDRLGAIAEAWLVHDRPIHMPCDDSVVRVSRGRELPVRRARGFAPLPVPLPLEAPPVLATGGELKTTFCLASGRHAWVSQHLGDMGSVETLAAFERAVRLFTECYEVTPDRSAADGHPDYQVRRWAEERGPGPVEPVQHHHAHIASVMAEHGVPPGRRVIGFAFDGTGFGTDGAVWGGEVLVASYREAHRVAHLAYVPLPGGDAAVRHPARVALAHLWAAGIPWAEGLAPVDALPPGARAVLARQLERSTGCVPTSSMGRLFDAVSSLLGLRQAVSFEAQAAMELEALAASHPGGSPTYRFGLHDNVFDAAPVLRAVVDDLAAGRPAGALALGFHRALASLVGDLAGRLAATDRHRTGGPVRRRVPERPPHRAGRGRAGGPGVRGAHPPHGAGQRRRPLAGPGRGGRGPGAGQVTTTVLPTPDAADGVAGDLAVAALDLARALHRGATLWCAAPRWPWHARHLAVEFVHPVIVGKRALPAWCVEGADLAAAVRGSSRPGDVLVGVGPAEDPALDDLVRRAAAWDVATVRLGAGAGRPAVPADHTLWVDGADPAHAPYDGGLVVLYHLWWELTHVALEHPGLLAAGPGCDDGHCVTCSDEGTVGEVRSVDGSRARVLLAGRTDEVDVALVAPVAVDQLVLVHAGVALATLGEGRP